ncbi:MAG: bifunctional indole-3-glycerol-phosphate synthase TrpC/phosphoribosylanthranilate isomerase TrpF [Sphingomicrobium sp.]
MAEGVLEAIVERKRRDVAGRLHGATFNAQPTHRSLRSALARPGARFIMEVKKASPSGHRTSVSVEAAVKAYAPVADAISVLTDSPFFGGSLADLRAARAGFDGPILAKDFIVDPAQVAEARAHGADAVLAIMAVLSDQETASVLDQAQRLSMDVLVEVHNERELQRALHLDAKIVGINNRDLATLTIDLSTTERLAALVPADRIIVSESGITKRTHVERLAPLVDAFLVGSSLMSAESVSQAARRLVFGPVKICGLSRAEDVRLAGRAGATHAGFVFVPGTPRFVSSDAASLVAAANSGGMQAVGVFRGHHRGEISQIANELNLDAVQVDGGDDLELLRPSLRRNCEIWGVCGVGTTVELRRIGADRTLFDTSIANVSGGSGRAFDWTRIAARPDLPGAFIAGGISPYNARAALGVGAYGLDVGSRVEAAPGHKDPKRMRSLFEMLRLDCRASIQCV